jgi:hypothetical protein
MKATTKSAEDAGHGESLAQVKDRFALWRKSRKRGEHISNALWSAAVGLAEQHGVQRVAQELRVNCNVLKKRIARNADPMQTVKAAPQFVELFAQTALNATRSVECMVEMENGRGGKMRVEINNISGLIDLASAFWSAR